MSLSLFVSLLCLTACQVKRPKGVIADARMENILYDYHLAKAMGEDLVYNETYKRVLYMEAVFKKYGVTQAQFDSSMVWFARHPEILGEIYEQVNNRLKAEREIIENLIALRDNKPRTSKPGDSIDVWAWSRILLLTGMPLDNKYTFVLPSDTNFKDRDTLRWNVGIRFQRALPDSLHAPVMAMQVQYANDSIISDMLRIYRSGMHTLTLHDDTLGAIKEVRGFIYYPTLRADNMLLTDTLSLMRYHATDSLSLKKDTTSSHSATPVDEIRRMPRQLQ
ncbi:MAG: DUF4296 domain-containing protein [Prevotellaceae bacterium]|jgi:hypothetical protein|nr:DUF4296 domain-containing protein [Prevotellaceae bacterium]